MSDDLDQATEREYSTAPNDFDPARIANFIGLRVLVTVKAGTGKHTNRMAVGTLAGSHRRHGYEGDGNRPEYWPVIWFEHQADAFTIPLDLSDAVLTITLV